MVLKQLQTKHMNIKIKESYEIYSTIKKYNKCMNNWINNIIIDHDNFIYKPSRFN
jgi:hypothetical protein